MTLVQHVDYKQVTIKKWGKFLYEWSGRASNATSTGTCTQTAHFSLLHNPQKKVSQKADVFPALISGMASRTLVPSVINGVLHQQANAVVGVFDTLNNTWNYFGKNWSGSQFKHPSHFYIFYTSHFCIWTLELMYYRCSFYVLNHPASNIYS